MNKTIAARVPLDLRVDLEAIAKRDGVDLGTVMRAGLRRHANLELARRPGEDAAGGAGLFQARAGASHAGDPATSRNAAKDTAPRTGTGRWRALERIVHAGLEGMTADELLELDERAGLKPAGNGIARRVSELKRAGAIMPKLEHYPAGPPEVGPWRPVTRKTRSGSDATVYVATAKGAEWLRAETTRDHYGVSE